MLMQSFFLRVFVYGLVGFAPEGNGASVLVVEDDHHQAFVGFDAECSKASDGSSCAMLELTGERPFMGFRLKGYEIELDPITGGQAPFALLVAERPGRLPQSLQEGGRFSWVPRMGAILGSEPAARIDPVCVASPPSCKVRGWMTVKRGTFTNCDFSEPKGAGARLYSYQFKDSAAGEPRLEQALAEVVQISQRVSSADSVRLNLKDARGRVVEAVRLAPKRCTAEMPPDSMCVDVFVGNVGKKDPEDPRTAGPHFARFYDLLLEKRTSKPTPYVNEGSSTNERVQPYCRVVPPPPPRSKSGFFGRLLGRFFGRKNKEVSNVEIFPLSPDSRPICPMVVYNN